MRHGDFISLYDALVALQNSLPTEMLSEWEMSYRTVSAGKPPADITGVLDYYTKMARHYIFENLKLGLAAQVLQHSIMSARADIRVNKYDSNGFLILDPESNGIWEDVDNVLKVFVNYHIAVLRPLDWRKITRVSDPLEDHFMHEKLMAGVHDAKKIYFKRDDIAICARQAHGVEIVFPHKDTLSKSQHQQDNAKQKQPVNTTKNKGGHPPGPFRQAIEHLFDELLKKGETSLLQPKAEDDFIARLKLCAQDSGDHANTYIAERIDNVIKRNTSKPGIFSWTINTLERIDENDKIHRKKTKDKGDVSGILKELRKKYHIP